MLSSCNVLFVYPQFPANTFWNNKAVCKVQKARHSAIPLGLITVAALLPADWTCRLIDRNVSDVTEKDFAWADLILTGGMNVQRFDCLKLIAMAQEHGKIVVVGGPDITSEPNFYSHADFRIIGEAESVIDKFVAAWRAGHRTGTFIAEKFTADVTSTPVPRFDLVRPPDYLYFAVQFSRGCPFTCEFCDIIELYGRVPRVKTPAQMLHELKALYTSGYRGHVDFVDDNFIGNKKAIKRFLPHLIAWQEEHSYPFSFSTEASINLADDDELLALMRRAGFFVVFVGIESPDTATLVATQKKQNARRSLSDSIHKIYRAGMFVIAGFIVGFDSERASVTESLVTCIEDADIPISVVGLLTALANTQLARRLKRENRVYSVEWQARLFEGGGDQCTLGLNFETLRPRRDVLSDYKKVVERVYAPRAYFGRINRVMRRLDCFWPDQKNTQQGLRFAGLERDDWATLLRLMVSVIRKHPLLLGYYVKALYTCARVNPGALRAVVIMAAYYLHLGPFSRGVTAAIAKQIEDIDMGRWQSPLASLAVEPTANEFLSYVEGKPSVSSERASPAPDARAEPDLASSSTT